MSAADSTHARLKRHRVAFSRPRGGSRTLSPSALLEIEAHARASLDALLAFARALENGHLEGARLELDELRCAVTAMEAARGRAFPVMPPTPAERIAALGHMLSALSVRDPLKMARALAMLEPLVPERPLGQ